MNAFSDVFGGDTVPPSEYAFVAHSLTADAQLVWPENYSGTDLLVASITEITASAGLSLLLPPANLTSPGKDILLRNVGANSFTVKTTAGDVVSVVAPGEAKYLYVTDNTTFSGVWKSFTFGTGTSSADAAALAGGGLFPISGTLNQNAQVVNWAGDYTVLASDRAKVINITAGTVTVSLPKTSTLELGYFVSVRNSAAGEVVVDGFGSEQVDGSLSKTLAPGETATFHSTGAAWVTTGYGRDVTFTFSEFVIDAAIAAHNLTSTQVAGRMLRVSGTATAPVTVTVPGLDNLYFVNVESGMGIYQVTFTTGLGTTVTLSANQQTVIYSDGINLKTAVNTALSPLSGFADGVVGAPAIYFLLDTNTGLYRPGSGMIGMAAGGADAFTVGSAKNTSYKNLEFSGYGLRVTGDFSNATTSSRTMLKTSTTNGVTSVGAIPNGTSQSAAFYAYNASDPNNASWLSLNAEATENIIRSDKNGAGTVLPMSFYVGSTAKLQLKSDGSLVFPQTGQRITGDFSNATPSNRVCFQSSVANGSTSVHVIPNGSSVNSGFRLESDATLANSSLLTLDLIGGADARISSSARGAGSILPMTFYAGANERMRMTPAGDLGIGTTSPNYAGFSHAVTIEGTVNAAVEIVSSRPDIEGVNVGGIDWNFRNNAVGHQRVGNLSCAVSGATATQRGGLLTVNLKNDGNTTTTERLRVDSGGIKANGSVGVGTGGTYVAGSLYSDLNWGLLIRAKQSAPVLAEFSFRNADDAARINIAVGGRVEIPNYTKLGDVAPAIKVKKLTGTTPATEGATASVAHGVTASKIIGVQILVRYYPDGGMLPGASLNHPGAAGYSYASWHDGNAVYLSTHVTDSENILSKPFIALITYEE